MAAQRKKVSLLRWLLHRLFVVSGGLAIVGVLFLVLPLLQHIAGAPQTDLELRAADTADVPPPPPPPEEQKEPDKAEDKPPDLAENTPLMDLSQMEVALNPMGGTADIGGDLVVKLAGVAGAGASGGGDGEGLFGMDELDQQPRVVHQPGPVLTPKLREKAPGTVHIIFIVDKTGRVENPIVQKSTDQVFEAAALAAVKQWKFEPGKRKGQPVRFRMRVPITFPKGK